VQALLEDSCPDLGDRLFDMALVASMIAVATLAAKLALDSWHNVLLLALLYLVWRLVAQLAQTA
jgi:hypothetical protein